MTSNDEGSVVKDVNPYAPSCDEGELAGSWWSRLFKRLLRHDQSVMNPEERAFQKGKPIVCSGIAFFVDPEDRSTLYAGKQSSDRSDQRVAMIANEALRLLPNFLADHEQLAPNIVERRLVVRITHSNDGVWSDYYRAVEVLPSPLRNHVAPGFASTSLPPTVDSMS